MAIQFSFSQFPVVEKNLTRLLRERVSTIKFVRDNFWAERVFELRDGNKLSSFDTYKRKSTENRKKQLVRYKAYPQLFNQHGLASSPNYCRMIYQPCLNLLPEPFHHLKRRFMLNCIFGFNFLERSNLI